MLRRLAASVPLKVRAIGSSSGVVLPQSILRALGVTRGKTLILVPSPGSAFRINNLFSFPYTKIEFIQNDLKVSRLTATRYLDVLAEDGLLIKRKFGRSNYYINEPLFRILTGEAPPTGE